MRCHDEIICHFDRNNTRTFPPHATTLESNHAFASQPPPSHCGDGRHLAEGRRARRRLVLALPRGEIFVLVLVPSLLLINHSRDAPPALRRRLELYDGVTHVALPRIVGASGGHSSLRCRYERKALQWGEWWHRRPVVKNRVTVLLVEVPQASRRDAPLAVFLWRAHRSCRGLILRFCGLFLRLGLHFGRLYFGRLFLGLGLCFGRATPHGQI